MRTLGSNARVTCQDYIQGREQPDIPVSFFFFSSFFFSFSLSFLLPFLSSLIPSKQTKVSYF